MKRLLVLLLLCGATAQAQIDSPESGLDDPTPPVNDAQFGEGFALGLGLGGAGIAALLGALYFLGVGGLRHVDANNVLEHPLRASLMQAVEEEPGIHLRELATRHDTAVTNTQWHLRKLEMANLVRTQKVQGRRLYYPTSGGAAMKTEALQNAATSNPNAKAILEAVTHNPGINQKALAETLNMNPGTVRWHLRKLESTGVVQVIQEGTKACYFLAAAGRRGVRPKRVVESETVVVPE